MTRASSPRRVRASLRGVVIAVLVGALVGTGMPAVADTATDVPREPGADSQIVTPDEAAPDGTPSDEQDTVDDTPADPAPEPEPETPGTEGDADPETEVEAGPEAVPDAETDAATDVPAPITITPFAIGPDGAAPPYVYWETRTAANVLVGGATYELQGPRTGLVLENWNTLVTVTDCITAPCAGPDLDPDPGEFLVKAIGSHQISSSNRYRLRQQNAPSGYYFTTPGNAWTTIPGTGNTPGGWQNQTYGFGTFRVTQQSNRIRCEAGYIYQISGDGWLRQVAPNGTITNLAQASGSSVNGLGIGRGGSAVYAYERSNPNSQVATMRVYDPMLNTWTSSTDSYNTGLGNALVAGAVDLASGKFMFGGFTADGTQFRIYRYNPGETPRFTSLGAINTSFSASSASNGDMAFDANGNLYVIRGVGNSTTVFSVTAANLAAAGGGTIASSRSEPINTMSGVNGVAFDADGRSFLGSSGELRRYNMPSWTGPTTITTSMNGSTDLASCGSPPTITIQKDVRGRQSAGDQFALALTQGGTTLGTATTSGTATGIQVQQIGPLPTVRGAVLGFSEGAAGTTNMANYGPSYSCSVDGVLMSPPVAGAGTSGSVTIPNTGSSIVCTFTNAHPLAADVTVTKYVQDASGGNTQLASGWTVGATIGGTTGGAATTTPTAPTQQTGVNGQASWRVNFSAAGARTNLTVIEQQQSAYTLVNGVCEVSRPGNPVREIPVPAEAPPGSVSIPVDAVAPGDSVNCVYINRLKPTTLTLVKQVVNEHGGTSTAADWTLTAAGPTPISGVTGAAAITAAAVQPGAYDLSEASAVTGYDASAWSCVGGSLSGSRVTIAQGDEVTCTIVNRDRPATLTLVKTVDNGTTGGTAIAADWTLTASGPTPVTGAGGSASIVSQTVSAGSYTLSEALTDPDGPTGYAAGAWACTGGAQNGSAVTIALGQNVTCTITNTAVPSALTLVKVVDNGDTGATAQPSDWTLTADPQGIAGQDAVTGAGGSPAVTGQPVRPGGYELSEEGLPGYDASAWTCISRPVGSPDGTDLPVADGLVAVALGQDVTCTIINTAAPSTLTLAKVVAYGAAAPASWTLTAGAPAGALPGPTGTTGSAAATGIPVSVGAAYQLSEDAPLPTYLQDGAWVCETADGDTVTVVSGAVTLPQPGLDVTCTVSNTTATLVLLKHVTDGATFAAADFTITATPATGVAGLVAANAAGAETPGAANTFEVRPGHTYTLSEASTSTSLAYRNTVLQVLVGTDPADDTHWQTVTAADVTVPAGEQRVYRFVNDPVPAVVLPLTGGLSTDAFLILGLVVVGLALILSAWHGRRSRKRGAHE